MLQYRHSSALIFPDYRVILTVNSQLHILLVLHTRYMCLLIHDFNPLIITKYGFKLFNVVEKEKIIL